MISSDILATTNPALGAVILWQFLRGFSCVSSEGCEFPLMFLPLPIVLSGSMRRELNGNTTTGLLTWIARNPHAILGFPELLNSTVGMTQHSILFGQACGALALLESGRFIAVEKAVKQSKLLAFQELKEYLSCAKRLGQWFATNSTSTIFNSLGVRI